MGERKTCPECAEQVLAPARVCRFCGYRFDGAGPLSKLTLRKRPEQDRQLPELLSDWGVELAEREDVTFFGRCMLKSENAYLLLTSTRVILLEEGSQKQPLFSARPVSLRQFLNVRREDVREVESGSRWRRSWLALSGPYGRITLSGFNAKNTAADLADQLRGIARS